GRWTGQTLPVSAPSPAAADRITERFAAAFSLDDFSLGRAAETLAEQLGRLDRWEVTDDRAGDFVHQALTVLRNAAPILIDLAERAGVNTRLTASDSTTSIIVPDLPRLGTEAV
ncbi:methionine--tRNA ligase, partial [Streptomyces anulatus]